MIILKFPVPTRPAAQRPKPSVCKLGRLYSMREFVARQNCALVTRWQPEPPPQRA